LASVGGGIADGSEFRRRAVRILMANWIARFVWNDLARTLAGVTYR
jgi:hypothetical protein